MGCVDPRAPDNTWIQKDVDTLSVRCNATGNTWYLVKRDSEWFGYSGNFSATHSFTTKNPESDANYPMGIVVAVGVIVGLLMLGLVGSCCVERKRKHKETQSISMTRFF